MTLVRPWLAVGAEVSLEANPDDVTGEALATWRELGFTRLSMGVQTFAERGLKLMQRIHQGPQAEDAIGRALGVFPNLNIDLIYGWPGQSLEDFAEDLRRAVRLKVPHLSLYTLTFESRTPLGRAAHRGKVDMQTDDQLAAMYDLACEVLGAAGYVHEEVSNWALPGTSCAHNWLYWDDAPFIGVGPGAHGYLSSVGPAGVRYAYPRSDRMFIKQGVLRDQPCSPLDGDSLAKTFGVEIEADRDLEVWFMEYVGASLRTCRGTSLSRIGARLGRPFAPTPALQSALAQGLCRLNTSPTGDERIVFTPAEWYREVAWAVELLGSFPSR
jgi:oxygen-independent coproporphyrinogen-3 oxidase